MKSKFSKVLGLVLTCSLILAGCSSKSNQEDKSADTKVDISNDTYIFKLGHAADENNSWHKGAIYFADKVNELSEGRIEIKVYPNEQLGNEIDNVTAIQAGTADMVLSGESLQNWADKVGIMSAPYLIKSSEHLKAVMESEPGKILEKEIEEKAGLKPLTYFERGPRMLTSNKPINNINDLQGLKIRIPSVPLFVQVWDNWGAKPTPMAFNEVFTSLQQNTIEAQENPLALMNSGGFYEVQKYINDTSHVRGWIYLLIGNEQWNSLPEDLQSVMLEAASLTKAYENELFLADEEKILNSLIEEKGMEFVETDTTEMIESAKKYYNENLSPELLELYNQIESLKEE